MEYYIFIAVYIWKKLSIFFHHKLKVISRIFEGISIGIYANNVGTFIDSGANLDLLYKFSIAIILTIASIFLEKEK